MTRLFFLILLCFVAIMQTHAATPYEEAARYNANQKGVSLVIMKDGVIVHESYPGEGNAERGWELASGTKSFSSIIAAAAVMDGLLALDERAADTLIEWRDDSRADITIRDLLTLTSGIASPPPFRGRGISYAEATAQPAVAAPGEVFNYGLAPFQIFGEIMRRKLEAAYPGQYRDPVDYLQARVFGPIGVRPAGWKRDDGLARMPSGARLTARDWALFGEFVRQGGQHEGRQLVDAATLEASFSGTATNPGYGLTWWLNQPIPMALATGNGPQANATDLYTNPEAANLPADLVMAAGAGKQRLYIIPSEGLVIVRQQKITLRGLRGKTAFSDVTFLRLVLEE